MPIDIDPEGGKDSTSYRTPHGNSLIFVVGDFSSDMVAPSSLTIKNTWRDWHLVPSSRPTMPEPNPTYKYVDIPGRDGSLDLSNYLIGRPTYSDLSGSFSFYVAQEDPYTARPFNKNWIELKDELALFFNAQTIMKMFLEEDDQHYYEGRFYFKGWQTNSDFSQVTIEYRVKPEKYAANIDWANLVIPDN